MGLMIMFNPLNFLPIFAYNLKAVQCAAVTNIGFLCELSYCSEIVEITTEKLA